MFGSSVHTYSYQDEGDMVNECLIDKLRSFIEDEARSGSMDFGCITSLYAFRMFGGQYSIEDIETGLMELRKQGYLEL